MCIQITEEDFTVVHHELGHNYYQMAYAGQPFLYRDSANDGFHEAIGDTMALSVTPPYLKQLGLINTVPDPSADTGFLLATRARQSRVPAFWLSGRSVALESFLRRGQTGRLQQSLVGAAREVSGHRAAGAAQRSRISMRARSITCRQTFPIRVISWPHILQFQFHRALCREAGFSGPLYQCSIYGNKKAGEKLKQMLAMGVSKPWPEALKAMTGEDKMDATAIIDYFAPLKTWLDAENQKAKGQ